MQRSTSCTFALISLLTALSVPLLSAGWSWAALPEIQAPTLPASPHTVKLPGVYEDIVVGGGGRYLVFYLKMQRQLGVFDVNTAEIVKYLPVPTDDILFAAGADKLVLVIPDQKIIQRWSLDSFERELTQTLETSVPVVNVSMGAASQGPILIGCGDRIGGNAQLLDLRTLKQADIEMPNQFRVELGRSTVIRASANGHVFGAWRTGVSPAGLSSLVIDGSKAQQYYEHESVGYIVPSTDGSLLYTARGIFTNETNRVATADQDSGIRLIPALCGTYALGFARHELPEQIRRETAKAQGKEFQAMEGLSIHVDGDYEPLARIPGIRLPEDNGHPMRSSYYRSPEQQLFFIPPAKLLVFAPETRDQLVLHRVDLEQLLRDATRDYLIVESSAQDTADPGTEYRYTLKVRSSKGSVKYKLETGPAGMKIGDNGDLSWQVPEQASGTKPQVIVSISDASATQKFHTFAIQVSGQPQSGGSPAVAGGPEGADTALDQPLDLKTVEPINLAEQHVEYRLPATIDDLAWAAGGRLLILHFRSLRKLGVFDVNVGKIIHYIPVADNNTAFAAGATKLVTVAGDQRLMSRYDLTTMKRDLTIPLDVSEPVRFAVMGHASEGPLLIGTAGTTRGAAVKFYELSSLKPLPVEGQDRVRVGGEMRVSADGHVFGSWQVGVSPSGLTCYVLNNNHLAVHSQHTSAGHIRPSPDGRVLCTGSGLYTNQCVATGGDDLRRKCTIPSVTGYFFVSPDLDQHARTPQEFSLGIYMLGDSRRLYTVTDLPAITEGIFARGNTSISFDKRIHFHPEADLIITIPPTADRLHLRKFDLNQALEESGIDYLIVTSRPPLSVKAGESLRYVLAVQSKKGGLKYKVEAGPEGMQFTDDGALVWQVPKDAPSDKQNVILLVSDTIGQEVYHSFELEIEGHEPKVVVAPPPKQPSTPVRTGTAPSPNDNPFEPPSTSSLPHELPYRTWTDKSGKHKIEARFLRLLNSGEVELLRKDDKTVKVPLAKLSDYDRGYAEALGDLKLELKGANR